MNWLRNSERSEFTRKVGRLLHGEKKVYFIVGSIQFLLLFVTLGTPYLYKILVDQVLISGHLKLLLVVISGYLLSYLLETFFLVASTKHSNRLSNLLGIRLKKQMWRNFLRFYYEKFRFMGTGELKNQIDNDVETVSTFPSQQIIQYRFNIILLAALSVVMLVINWPLALFGFVSIPISFWMTKWLGKTVYETSNRYRTIYAGYEGWLKETLQEWKEIKSFNLQKRREVQFTTYWGQLSRIFFRTQMYTTMNRTFISFKDFFVTKLNLYFVGGIFIINGHLSIGSLVLFMSYYDLAFSTLGNINDLDLQLQQQKPSLNRVFDTVLHVEKLDSPLQQPVPFDVPIKFANVSFGYHKSEEPVLRDFNIQIHPGEWVTIVGRSGVGKSTVAKLLSGMLTPTTGTIWLDDRYNLHQLAPEQISRNIGIVMQDSILFHMSIKENLLLANPDASMEEIKRVCQISQIDTWIEELPDQYDTVIGEKGMNLSGGQRQRIVIARVLLQQPQVIVLDEATSQLDHEVESNLLRSVRDNLRGTTFLIVTHRLQSVLLSDRTVLLEDGKLVSSGTHHENMESNLTYRKMFLQQKAVKVGGEMNVGLYHTVGE